ncbi:hypothetical protein [Candidimonas nitroreducens]|uniref:Uncharacterized protein n=1 Tax=Candidimonas nitroreducens TaxID=683354 RepID=A0A225M9G7_9BURK|nr:hypothetical protein [Candidimonas nitroreducens]OWT56191.1 hypothetical protein CEY11_19375 [Candidimonas nitroreducens]
MEGKGTGPALAAMGVTTALALLLIYIAWKRPDLHDHMLGAVLGGILLVAVLAGVILFFVLPDNRRPTAFFLTFFVTLTLPGSVFLIARAYSGLRLNSYDLDAPGMPSPLLFLLPYIVVMALLFLRMVSWSMTFEPAPGSHAISAQDLRQRMLVMNSGAEFPFTVSPGKRADEVIVDWKYADAAWLDLMRIHKISSLSRITIRFDETDHTARVHEQEIQFNASGGLDGLNLSFNMKWGAVTFYEHHKETVYGIQIEHGRPVAKLSYSYEFDIREMRDPLLKLTTENGWRFKCVPLFVKWLTG